MHGSGTGRTSEENLHARGEDFLENIHSRLTLGKVCVEVKADLCSLAAARCVADSGRGCVAAQARDVDVEGWRGRWRGCGGDHILPAGLQRLLSIADITRRLLHCLQPGSPCVSAHLRTIWTLLCYSITEAEYFVSDVDLANDL